MPFRLRWDKLFAHITTQDWTICVLEQWLSSALGLTWGNHFNLAAVLPERCLFMLAQPVWPGRHPGRFGWISYLPTFDSLCLISWPTFHTSYRCGIWAGIPGSCGIPGAPWTYVWPCQENQPLGEGAGRSKYTMLSQEQWASRPSLGCLWTSCFAQQFSCVYWCLWLLKLAEFTILISAVCYRSSWGW